MRTVLAALVDTAAVVVLAFIGFRLAVSSAPCSDLGDCAVLTPLVVILAALLVAAYFVVGYLAWRRTPGDRLLG